MSLCDLVDYYDSLTEDVERENEDYKKSLSKKGV